MSVLKSERKTSTMEYIANSVSLAARVLRFSLSMPKRYTFKIGDPIFRHAEDVVFHCKAANSTYVNSQETFDLRRGHLIEADVHLNQLESLMEIYFEDSKQDEKSVDINDYTEIIKMIEKERKLISGCKRSDTAMFNEQKQKY